MSDNNELLNLFSTREDAYHEVTKSILWAMLPALKGIVTFFGISDRAANGYLEWEDAVLMKFGETDLGEPAEDVVFVSGRITYDVGETYETEAGHRIEVTEENQPYMTKFIKIGLPVSIILTQDEQTVVDFLTQEEIRKNMKEIEMQRMAEDYAAQYDNEQGDDFEHEYGSEISEVDFSELIAKINENIRINNSEPSIEFDVDELTPEQKASYLMYLKTTSKQ